MDGSEDYNSDKSAKKYKSFLGIRSDRLIFIICLFIASLFWLLIKLSHVYSVNYTFGVKYNNAPPSMRLTNLVDTTLDLNLTARGFAILKLNLFNDMETLDINLGNYNIIKGDGSDYMIYTQELITTLSELVNVDEKDISLSRSALKFEMEKTGEKEVPIIPNFSINFMDQYDLYSDVETNPKSVVVYGPQKVLDTLLFISTKELLMSDVFSDQVITVELENPNSILLNFQDNTVDLIFEVEKFTESQIVAPINISNIKYKIKTFPSQVAVYYKVAQKDFNEVRIHQFNIVPVVDNLDIVYAKKLPLKVLNQPDFVRSVRIVPQEVEFLIIK